MAKTSNQTQKELVRLLVIQHGLQKASELSGVPYDLVRQWESRRQRKEKQIVTNVTNPVSTVVKNVESELADNERKTKLSLSRYAQRVSQDAEKASLRDSPYVKQVAQVAAITHRWDAKEQQGNTVVNVAILGVDPSTVSVEAAPVIDAESGVSE